MKEEEMANPYDVLEIVKNASFKEIQTAFRRLSRKFHPDLNPNDPNAVEKFQEIKTAYEMLSDPKQRGDYDRSGGLRLGRGPIEAIRSFWNKFFGVGN